MAHPNNSSFSREKFKRDQDFQWRPKRLYIPAWNFAGLDYETTTAIDIKSIGAGSGNDMAIAEVNTSNVTGIAMGANADTVETLIMLPSDYDPAHPCYFRVYWTANNTSGTVTWDVLYKSYVADSTVVGSAAATTALDAAIGADTMAGVAFTLMRTPEGRMNGGKLAKDVELIQLSVKRTAATTITSAIFMGLEMRYTPHRLYYGSMTNEAKDPQYIHSNQYN